MRDEQPKEPFYLAHDQANEWRPIETAPFGSWIEVEGDGWERPRTAKRLSFDWQLKSGGFAKRDPKWTPPQRWRRSKDGGHYVLPGRR